jgi:hypothetical protein
MKKAASFCLGLGLILGAYHITGGEPDKRENPPKPKWNDGKAELFAKPWAKEKGMAALQAFPPIDPRGYDYVEDFMKWASVLLKPEFLPKGIKARLIPLRKGNLPVLCGSPPESAIADKDGFVVRFKIGDYLVQVTDTRYDLRIVVRDLSRKKEKYTDKEREAFARGRVKKILKTSVLSYPDGKPRKTWTKPLPTHFYIQWNWRIKDSKKDDAQTGSVGADDAYSPFVGVRSDGRSLMMDFAKNYGRGLAVALSVKEDKTSRFSADSRFPEKPKKESENKPK